MPPPVVGPHHHVGAAADKLGQAASTIRPGALAGRVGNLPHRASRAGELNMSRVCCLRKTAHDGGWLDSRGTTNVRRVVPAATGAARGAAVDRSPARRAAPD